ncbi:FUSC family protein [Streptomyces sp. CA-250714]|uniref:FUSC family protein n=1 Tax=Streptomyces sp. CA-250714 TaxID=3240060 RepID=UPI003D91BFE2
MTEETGVSHDDGPGATSQSGGASHSGATAHSRAASPGRWARAGRWLARAKGTAGHERHTLELIGKSTLAASASWFVAHDLMAAQTPAFAPFSAVLIMQVTIYQSLLQALRYLAAVCAGVCVQGALGFLAGPDLLTFVLVALIALTIGRWQRLGSQGTQVATAAFFAFSTYVSATGNLQRIEQLGQILELVGIGCGIGVLINVTLLPPMRYRGAEEGIRALAHSQCDLIGDIHPALREGDMEEERTWHWRQRAATLGSLVSQARSALHTAVESKYYNPRLLLPGHTAPQDFSGYQELIDALERVSHQLTSMTRTLHQWPQDESGEECRGFLRDYAALLEALERITRQFSEIDEHRLTSQLQELYRATEAAQRKRTELVERTRGTSLPLGDPSRPYGILLAEATRLMDEAQHTCDILQHSVREAAESGELRERAVR